MGTITTFCWVCYFATHFKPLSSFSATTKNQDLTTSTTFKICWLQILCITCIDYIAFTLNPLFNPHKVTIWSFVKYLSRTFVEYFVVKFPTILQG